MKKTTLVLSVYAIMSIFSMLAQKNYKTAQAYDAHEFRPLTIDTMDRFFQTYANEAQLYLDREIFSGTPMTGVMMAECARNTYNATGIVVPVELALSQAQWESGMGRKGRSPKRNPYNIGEWSDTTVLAFKTTKEGVQAYYDLIANDYLSHQSINELLNDFTNKYGHRYAGSDSYEAHISNTYKSIRYWINEQSDTI